MKKICNCGNCKHYNDCLNASGGIDQIKDDHTCEDWEEETWLTKEEEDEIIGDYEAHRIMVEGRDI